MDTIHLHLHSWRWFFKWYHFHRESGIFHFLVTPFFSQRGQSLETRSWLGRGAKKQHDSNPEEAFWVLKKDKIDQDYVFPVKEELNTMFQWSKPGVSEKKNVRAPDENDDSASRGTAKEAH
jgi:hypothetical protein